MDFSLAPLRRRDTRALLNCLLSRLNTRHQSRVLSTPTFAATLILSIISWATSYISLPSLLPRPAWHRDLRRFMLSKGLAGRAREEGERPAPIPDGIPGKSSGLESNRGNTQSSRFFGQGRRRIPTGKRTNFKASMLMHASEMRSLSGAHLTAKIGLPHILCLIILRWIVFFWGVWGRMGAWVIPVVAKLHSHIFLKIQNGKYFLGGHAFLS